MSQSPALMYSDEDEIDYTPAAAVTAGDVVVIGDSPCIAPRDIAANAKGALATNGVWKVPKKTGAITLTDKVYWNPTGDPNTGTAGTGAATTSPAGAYLMGLPVAAAASGDDYVYVFLAAFLAGPGGGLGSGITEVNTNITTVGAGTLTAAAITGGVITRSGSTAAYTDTTATAALIVAALENPVVGQAWELVVKNTVAFAQTLAAGAGVTLSGQTVIPPLHTGRFLVTYSAAGAVTIQGLSLSPIASLPPAQFNSAATSNGAAAAGELSGANFCVMKLTANGANAYTTRTGAQMYADIPNVQIGMTYVARIIAGGDNTVTLTAGATGITITGTATAATGKWRDFLVTVTAANTLTFQDIGGN